MTRKNNKDRKNKGPEPFHPSKSSESTPSHKEWPDVIIFHRSGIHPQAGVLFGMKKQNDNPSTSSLKSYGSGNSNKTTRDKKYYRSNEDSSVPNPEKETTVPDDGWVIEINSYGEGADYDSGKSWKIFRIPRNMFEISKNAYIPKLVSIGPFHHGDGRYKAMEEHKKRYLLRLLGYTGATPSPSDNLSEDFVKSKPSAVSTKSQPAVGLGKLVNAMMSLEKETRACYSENVRMNKNNSFVQMMLMDGCFIVELLRLYYKYSINNKAVDDPIFTTRWMLCTLQRDLLMLENQLPFQVLELLYTLTERPGKDPNNVPLIDLILKFFNPLLRRDLGNIQVNREKNYNHMLDVFRTSFLPISPSGQVENQVTDDSSVLIHSATELQEAGVKFSKKSEQVTNLLSVRFDRFTGTLHIPPLQIDDSTLPLFLNFMAYEQCDRDAEPYFSNHFIFLDRLVNTAKDIEILHNKGVINHALGSDKDVANLINKLSREIIYDADTCHLGERMKELNMYYDECADQWYVWFKALKRDYFSSPWTVASLIAAVFLLLLTVCQTYFSFYGYFKPPKQP
ncbi:hypothetical protein MKW94_011872 [Papaver nudicaule]|uniref:Uncharacterized protein n=1 Tax=Papaver nudicaule TaxID=74823 RepID=A0AA41VGI7_PAPNU|nr:hypothetical protein [Papaver nudicaule]